MKEFEKKLSEDYLFEHNNEVYVKMDGDTMDFMRKFIFGSLRKRYEASALLGLSPLEFEAGINRLLHCETWGALRCKHCKDKGKA